LRETRWGITSLAPAAFSELGARPQIWFGRGCSDGALTSEGVRRRRGSWKRARGSVNTESELHSFDCAWPSILGGFAGALAFDGSLADQVGRSVTLKIWSFERFNSAVWTD